MPVNTNRSESIFDNHITLDELVAWMRDQYKKDTIYKWCAKEGFPHRKIAGRLWFDREKVSKWLIAHKEVNRGYQKAR